MPHATHLQRAHTHTHKHTHKKKHVNAHTHARHKCTPVCVVSVPCVWPLLGLSISALLPVGPAVSVALVKTVVAAVVARPSSTMRAAGVIRWRN
jgi:hypothetical protein